MDIKENTLVVNNVPQQLLDAIPHEYIVIGTNKQGKKTPSFLGEGYSYQQASYATGTGEYVAVNLKLKDTNYAVIDFDEDVVWEDIIDKYEICDTYNVPGNTKGIHAYIEVPNKDTLPEEFRKNIQKSMKGYDGDYLGEQVWERCDKQFKEFSFTLELQGQEMVQSFERLFNTDRFNVKKRVAGDVTGNTDTAELEKIAQLISTEHLTNRHSWMTIVTACKASGLSEAFTRSISQKCHNYTDEGFDGLWFQYEREDCTATANSLHYFAKDSNPEEYEKLTGDEPALNPVKFSRITTRKKETDEIKKMKEDLDDVKAEKKKKLLRAIKTFLQEQQDDEYKQKKIYFEKYHFKIVGKSLFGRLAYGNTTLHSKTEMEIICQDLGMSDDKRFFSLWLEDPEKRTYESADFIPTPMVCLPYVFNTFKGLRAEKLQETGDADYSIFTNHINILCGEEQGPTDYVTKYLAHIVQKPSEIPRVALVFKSDQGTGKNLFFENFGKKLLGKDYTFQSGDMDRVIGRFANTSNKLLVVLDEVSGMDGFRHSDKIKNLITADELPWERKGIDSVSVRNCGRYIIFSNNEAPVKIETTDRRFQVNKCSNAVRNDQTYFKALIKAFNDEGQVKAFYNYLKGIDISDWDTVNDRPITQAYKDLQAVATPITVKFLRGLLDDYHLQQETNSQLNLQAEEADEEDLEQLTASKLYIRFKLWLVETGHKNEMSNTRFGLQIKEHGGVTKARSNRGVIYRINYEELADYLEKEYPGDE
jgi:hypothetical protein